MSKVKFKVDYDCEMLHIEVDGKCFFGGNFWDFSRPGDIIELVEKLGHDVEVEEKEYDED